jgi:hypothetical protein
MRIAPFEHLMLGEDSHSNPMTCHVRLWFDGVFQRQNLESAAKMALRRHPLLRSIAIGDIRSRTANLSWKPLKNTQPSFRWVKDKIEDYTPDNRVLDPFSEICLKFYIFVRKTESL